MQKAYANRPEIEQNILNLRNNEITLRATKNNLLPTVDLYGFYGAAALGGAKSPFCSAQFFGPAACNVPTVGYGTVFTNLFNSSGPDKGAGVNVNVPLRNRTAQSLQARALLEYRQAEMRLQQLYIQVRIQVINGQYALTNDRAAVQAALAAREYNFQSYQSEVKKLRLGASTTANVLQQERNLATAENNIISTEATYAKDRASLEQLLAETLDQYGIQLSDAVKRNGNQGPGHSGSGAGKSGAGSKCARPATATATYGADAPVAGNADAAKADTARGAEPAAGAEYAAPEHSAGHTATVVVAYDWIWHLGGVRSDPADLSSPTTSTVLDGCPMFAPAYMGRKRILQMLSLHVARTLVLGRGFPRSRALKAGCASVFSAHVRWANMAHPSREEGFVLCSTSSAERKAQRPGDTLDILAALRILLFRVQMLQHQRRIRPE